jgi:hypothetical protein
MQFHYAPSLIVFFVKIIKCCDKVKFSLDEEWRWTPFDLSDIFYYFCKHQSLSNQSIDELANRLTSQPANPFLVASQRCDERLHICRQLTLKV